MSLCWAGHVAPDGLLGRTMRGQGHHRPREMGDEESGFGMGRGLCMLNMDRERLSRRPPGTGLAPGRQLCTAALLAGPPGCRVALSFGSDNEGRLAS